MSRFFIESFHPATTAWILRGPEWPRTLYETMFPDDVAVACPEVVQRLLRFSNKNDELSEDIVIRNPILGLNAAIGLTLGLLGGVTLLQTQQIQANDQSRRRRRRQQQKKQLEQSSSPNSNNNNHGYCCTTAWAWSLIGYGLMNAVALPLHSLVPAPQQQSCAQDYAVLWMLDCYFTGISAMAIVTAVRRESMIESHPSMLEDDDDDDDDNFVATTPGKISVFQEWALWNLPGTLAVLVFLLFGHTLPLEQWYILPTLLALVTMLWWRLRLLVHRDNNRSSSSSSLSLGHGAVRHADTRTTLLMAVALVLAVGGLLGDALTCRWEWQGGWLLDCFTFGNALFAACNVAFSAIFERAWRYLQARQQQQSSELDQDKKLQ